MALSDYLPDWARRAQPGPAEPVPLRPQPEVLNSERPSNAVRPATQAVATALDNAAYMRDFNRIDARGHIEEARAYRKHGYEGGSAVIAQRERLNLDTEALRENYGRERQNAVSRPDRRAASHERGFAGTPDTSTFVSFADTYRDSLAASGRQAASDQTAQRLQPNTRHRF